MLIMESGQVRTAYGITGSGPPLLLLHGAEADRRMFELVVPLLSVHFSVITYDQRDCGQTTFDGDAYSLADLAGDASALISGVGYGPAHVVGQSLGSAIAQLLATMHPDAINRLVLAAAFRVGVPLTKVIPEGVKAMGGLRAAGEEGVRGLAELFTTAEFVAANEGFIQTWRTIGPTTTPEQRARRGRAMGTPVGTVDLGKIAAPTLVLAGSRDSIIPPEHTRSIAQEIPGSRFRALPGIGHAGPLQAPEMFAGELIDFLLAGP
jgi:3-oxoadipate enol-lactonase